MLNKLKKGHLFLIEMLISLMFFSISAAVILRVFAAADINSRNIAMRESSIACAQSVAEVYSVCADAKTACERALGVVPLSEGTLRVYLGENCKPTNERPVITLTLSETQTETDAGNLCVLSMVFSSESGELYSLDCTAYLPDTGGAS